MIKGIEHFAYLLITWVSFFFFFKYSSLLFIFLLDYLSISY